MSCESVSVAASEVVMLWWDASVYTLFDFYLITVFNVAGALMFLNEATLLHNLRLRYMKNAIYVRVTTRLLKECDNIRMLT